MAVRLRARAKAAGDGVGVRASPRGVARACVRQLLEAMPQVRGASRHRAHACRSAASSSRPWLRSSCRHRAVLVSSSTRTARAPAPPRPAAAPAAGGGSGSGGGSGGGAVRVLMRAVGSTTGHSRGSEPISGSVQLYMRTCGGGQAGRRDAKAERLRHGRRRRQTGAWGAYVRVALPPQLCVRQAAGARQLPPLRLLAGDRAEIRAEIRRDGRAGVRGRLSEVAGDCGAPARPSGRGPKDRRSAPN